MTVLTLFDVETPEQPESWVYVIGVPGSKVVKIGVARDVESRLRGIQNGNPAKLEVLWRTPGSYELEKKLHRKFRPFRVQGEWFDFKQSDPVACVAAMVAHLSDAVGRDPAAFDPDAEKPEYQADRYGCRRLTPLEALVTGFSYVCCCHATPCPADWSW